MPRLTWHQVHRASSRSLGQVVSPQTINDLASRHAQNPVAKLMFVEVLQNVAFLVDSQPDALNHIGDAHKAFQGTWQGAPNKCSQEARLGGKTVKPRVNEQRLFTIRLWTIDATLGIH